MDEDESKRGLQSQKPRRFIVRVFVVVAAALVLFVLVSQLARSLFYNSRLATTIMRLRVIRSGIEEFKESTNRYPKTLLEMKDYGEKHPETALHQSRGKEFISDKKGNSQEVAILNGEGGWYYNKATGEVKVNLNKPLKHYLNSYFGPERNEIPSDW